MKDVRKVFVLIETGLSATCEGLLILLMTETTPVSVVSPAAAGPCTLLVFHVVSKQGKI